MNEQKEDNREISKRHVEMQVSLEQQTQKLRDADNKLKAAEERC